MNAVERFMQIAKEARFRGWPLLGEYSFGEKIPHFGQTLEYTLRTDDGPQDYASILRHFGWAEVFGINKNHEVITLIQWKPGVNCASWELPPGGIGKVESGTTPEQLLATTRAGFKKETGYGGGKWEKLGHVMIETGKYRGAGPEDHGLPAHLFLATDLEREAAARNPAANEIMETFPVPLDEFDDVIDSGLFVETSALACALLALRRLQRLRR